MEEISPLMEKRQGDHYSHEDSIPPTGCGCFTLFQINDRAWVVEKLSKVREKTELIAGPRWKNFIRKIGGHFSNKKKHGNTNTPLQYDSESYALNFDKRDDQEEEQGLLMHGFTSRFPPQFSVGKQRP